MPLTAHRPASYLSAFSGNRARDVKIRRAVGVWIRGSFFEAAERLRAGVAVSIRGFALVLRFPCAAVM
jgi:hypothetical protein